MGSSGRRPVFVVYFSEHFKSAILWKGSCHRILVGVLFYCKTFHPPFLMALREACDVRIRPVAVMAGVPR